MDGQIAVHMIFLCTCEQCCLLATSKACSEGGRLEDGDADMMCQVSQLPATYHDTLACTAAKNQQRTCESAHDLDASQRSANAPTLKLYHASFHIRTHAKSRCPRARAAYLQLMLLGCESSFLLGHSSLPVSYTLLLASHNCIHLSLHAVSLRLCALPGHLQVHLKSAARHAPLLIAHSICKLQACHDPDLARQESRHASTPITGICRHLHT